TPPDHPVWAAAKREKFFGLIVPDADGGTQLTPSGLSHVLQSLASVSASVPVHVMVPASLGPAELLVHYGTPAQRRHFLPRLAKGAIPCFGLTSLDAGSDAAGSMTDTGTAFRRADGTIGIRLECRKRYITLAPVADIVGMAFRLQDPEGLLESVCDRRVDGQITLALLERDTPNLEIGTYTDPLGVGFANGFVDALGVEIEVDDVIGGAAGLGEGWKFLMEALAAGRGIALPAGAAGSSKMLCNAVAGYAVVRRQFKTSISDFEGVQEKLADMAMKTYEIDSLVALMNCMLDDGERPPIMSAILKQRTTELGRDVVMHAMDIVAGSAICMGPQNFVAPAYLSSPIGITVEGSNTMTRSLLIFGQGLV
ncbi:MAG: acyl-CoA dehydrogenase family protein, partial [Actinomycetota bacterium]|nr:acyl-CoA dehydrogenase family protein [Actinomycetota bacterium]